MRSSDEKFIFQFIQLLLFSVGLLYFLKKLSVAYRTGRLCTESQEHTDLRWAEVAYLLWRMHTKDAYQLRLVQHRDHEHLLDTCLQQENGPSLIACAGQFFRHGLIKVEKAQSGKYFQRRALKRKANLFKQFIVMFLIDCIINVFISLEALFLCLVGSLNNELFLVRATLEEDAHLCLSQFGRGFNEFVLDIIHIEDGTDTNSLQRTIHRGQQ